MTKKTALIISGILFVVLVGLLALEVLHPTGGAAFLGSLFH